MNIILLSVLAAGAISSIGVTPDVMVSNNNNLQQIQERNTEKFDVRDTGINPRLTVPTVFTGSLDVDTSYRDLTQVTFGSNPRYAFHKEVPLWTHVVNPIYWPQLEVTSYEDGSGADFELIYVEFDSMRGLFIVDAEGYGNYCDGVITINYQYTAPTMQYGMVSIEALYTSDLDIYYQSYGPGPNIYVLRQQAAIQGVDPAAWPFLEITSYVDDSGSDFYQIDVEFDSETGIFYLEGLTYNQYLDGDIKVYYRYERTVVGYVDVEANYTWELKKFKNTDGSDYYLHAREVPLVGVPQRYWTSVESYDWEDCSGSGFYECDITFDSIRGMFSVFSKTNSEYLDGYIRVFYRYFPDRLGGEPVGINEYDRDDDYYDDIDDSAFENAPVQYAEFTDSDDTRIPYLSRYFTDNMSNPVVVTQSGKITGKIEYATIGGMITLFDNDWYKFTVTEEADYYFNFQSPSSQYLFRVVKNRGSQTPLEIYSKRGSTTRRLHLTFGTYYMHVTANNKNYVSDSLYTINYSRVEVRNDKFLLKPSMKHYFSMCVWENDALPDSVGNRWADSSTELYSVKGNTTTGYLDPYFLDNSDQIYLDSVLYVWDEIALEQIEHIAEGLIENVLDNYDEQDQIRAEEIRVKFINDTVGYGVSIFNDILGFIPFVSYAATAVSLMKDSIGLATTLINGVDNSFPKLKTAGEFCYFLGSLQTAAYYCRYYHGTMALPRYAKLISETKSGKTTYSWSSYYVEPAYTYRQYFHYTNACISQYQTITSNQGAQAKTFHGSLTPLKDTQEIGRFLNIQDSIY